MTTKTDSSEPEAERSLIISREFDAPRELVWEAWTNPEHVKNWWGPNGFSTTTEVMDVRPGGHWKHTMHGPDGANYPNHSVFREVVKPERIVYSHGGQREGGPGVRFVSTWTFEEIAPGRTRLTLCHVFPSKAERDFTVREFGAEEGGRQCLARLADQLAKMSSAGRDLVIVREFDAPRELVFAAWTDCKHVKNWWGPKEFTAPFCRIDLRPGGTFHFCMRSPEGKEYWNRGEYHEIVAPERITATMWFSDRAGNRVDPAVYGLAPGCPSEFRDRVTFEALGPNRTRLRLHRQNLPAISDAMFDGQKQGWNQSLDRFAEVLRTNG
ncbi:MAG TPA: SRPBCC domain-containing protein [Pirellulales bacterium]|nr:SRPBCC domain-containing protein [Pirellulales bacterium]